MRHKIRIGELASRKLTHQRGSVARQLLAAGARYQRIVSLGSRARRAEKHSLERAPAIKTTDPRQRRASRGWHWDHVRLLVSMHLDSVLERPEQAVGVGELDGIIRTDPSRCGKCTQCRHRGGLPKRRLASSEDHLMYLSIELDLANAAAP